MLYLRVKFVDPQAIKTGYKHIRLSLSFEFTGDWFLGPRVVNFVETI